MSKKDAKDGHPESQEPKDRAGRVDVNPADMQHAMSELVAKDQRHAQDVKSGKKRSGVTSELGVPEIHDPASGQVIVKGKPTGHQGPNPQGAVERLKQAAGEVIKTAQQQVEGAASATQQAVHQVGDHLASSARVAEQTGSDTVHQVQDLVDLLISGTSTAAAYVLEHQDRVSLPPARLNELLPQIQDMRNYQDEHGHAAPFSEQSALLATYGGLSEADQAAAKPDILAVVQGSWGYFGNVGMAPCRYPNLSKSDADPVDHYFAKKAPDQYNCFAYALTKAGLRERWMDALPNAIAVGEGFLRDHCDKVPTNQARVGDLVIVKNQYGIPVHAGVVEALDENGQAVIRQKPSAGVFQATHVIDQTLHEFSISWTGSENSSRVEVWQPKKR